MPKIYLSQFMIVGRVSEEEIKTMQEQEAQGDTVIVFLTGPRAVRRKNETAIRKRLKNPIFRNDGLDELLMKLMKDL